MAIITIKAEGDKVLIYHGKNLLKSVSRTEVKKTLADIQDYYDRTAVKVVFEV